MTTNVPRASVPPATSRPRSAIAALQARFPHAKLVLGAAAICLLTLAVYLPAMKGGYIWDDEVTLTDNPLVKAPDGLRDIWFSTRPNDYWPLTYTSFWIEWRLWGMNPAGYHVANVLLHIIGSVLLWRVLLRLRLPGAWFAALVFAVHPVCVGSVAWISERKNTLSLVFCLLSVLWYLRFDSASRLAPHPSRICKWYWLSLFAFLLALLSKTSVVMLPFVLWLCAWWLKGCVTRKDLLRTVPFIILSLGMGLATVWFQQHRAIVFQDYQTSPLLERLVAGSWALWFYLYKALVPVGLTVLYPRWTVNPHALVSYLPALAWLALLGTCWRFRRGWGRPLLFALACFSLTLLPVLGVFDMYYLVYSSVADHWQYLALIGPVTLVTGVLCGGVESLRRVRGLAMQAGGALVGAGLLVLLCWLSWQRAGIYADAEFLWRDALKKNPKSWVPPSDLGVALVNKGRMDDAVVLFREAIQISPNEGLPYNNLGMWLFERGKVEEAIAAERECLRLKPRFTPANFNLAVALARQQKWPEAAGQYEEVLASRPDSAEAHNNLANILGRLGKTNEARFHYAEAVRLRPDFPEANYNLGEKLAAEGKMDEAVKHYRRALQLRPAYANARCRLGEIALAHSRAAEAADHFSQALLEQPQLARAHFGLARSLAARGKTTEALEHFDAAIKAQPDFAEAYYGLGNLLMEAGKTNEVMSRFSAVLQSRPEMAEARYFVGMVLRQQGNARAAAEHWRRAVKSKPDWVEVLNNLAWLLATHPDAALRNGAEALDLAQRAVKLTGGRDAGLLDTLAAALAETGRFAEAAQTSSNALALATAAKDAPLVQQLEQRLRLYQNAQAVRE